MGQSATTSDRIVWSWPKRPRRPSGIGELREMLERMEAGPEPEEDSLSLPLPEAVEVGSDQAGS